MVKVDLSFEDLQHLVALVMVRCPIEDLLCQEDYDSGKCVDVNSSEVAYDYLDLLVRLSKELYSFRPLPF